MEIVQRQHPSQEIHQMERVASIVAGAALGYFGLREALKHHSFRGAGLAIGGIALIRHGVADSGAKGIPEQRVGNATIAYQQGVRVDRSTTINASREEVYAFWRNLENLPRFMKHVQSVKQLDDRRSHWVVEGPMGQKVEWDAEIINEIPNELLAWRSLPGASIDNAGSVHFEDATAGRGTMVSVSLQYEPPAGQVGVVLAKLLGNDPNLQVDMELHRLKNIIETGEIPTCIGQPSGRADDHAKHAKKSAIKQTEKVHDASEASFPASDAPAYSHVNGR